MGVDAEVLVKMPGRVNWLTDKQIKRMSYELGDALGSDFFFVVNPMSAETLEPRLAVTAMQPIKDADYAADYGLDADAVGKVVWTQDGDPIIAAPDEQFLKLNLYHRFYGKGYERGSWPKLRALLTWLRIRLPAASVWYGGDSSGAVVEEVTDDFLADLDAHWAESGRRPYVGAFRSIGKGYEPTCPLCDEPMMEQGGSNAYSFFWCPGCGQKATVLHATGEASWAQRHHDYPTWNGTSFEQRRPAA